MKTSTPIHPMLKPKRQRLFLCSFISTLLFLSAAFFIGSAFVIKDYKERFLEWEFVGAMLKTRSKMCETTHRPHGTEALPKGIVSTTSDLEMRSLWGPRNKKNSRSTTNLLAMAVGIKQKESVDKIVKKFLSSNFVVMLFHYDGIVNEWRDLKWSDNAIHVSAVNQTKWWFAKHFLHPDIIFEYAYIFLWDEDLGVEYFDIERYLSIVKEEGLEISQPALDPDKSEVHHDLTSRDNKSNIHRRIHKVLRGGRKCDNSSTDPPCTGWVEMMAPAFSKASWRCVWHMIQNDLVHAWGLDFQLGYCVQGDRTKKIGIVDSVYIIHYGLPTLGGSAENKTLAETPNQASQTLTSENREQVRASHQSDGRAAVRRQSFIQLEIFKNRWKKAVRDDNCWTDPFQQQQQQSKI
ncbi:Lysine ketoglutarate reductase trans-splicing-like protein, putative (DUF707) [Quillaja saponaria]|uniref:Lysine ketoglutarate reductase trans-splicing-like protein, putative (DUF707) n=1 Tax=Quillaja saponaria TaxID=32244 RepID=A0AAD7LP13_QUISA|nr:Lysine ketoglutarate reductase trans-splicing-like protein, putative (DUF707) [Quillaja saponaria]